MKNSIVKLNPKYALPNELDSRYEVVEDNGDRVLIRLICSLPFAPIEMVDKGMIDYVKEGAA